MQVRTDQPFLTNKNQISQKIAKFWDKLSPAWYKIWGIHIHHGYYEKGSSLTPVQAQEKLIEKLAELSEITPEDKILDAGCGMGGTSIYLAKKFKAKVIGITLSSQQMMIAIQQARKNQLSNAIFQIEDAVLLANFAEHTFDLIWSLESCEQFYDKSLFIENAFRVLKPGGRLLLATWCSGQEEYSHSLAKKYKKLCLSFDLPYVPTIECYAHLLRKNGFIIKEQFDWSQQVEKSWEVGMNLIHGYSFLQLLMLGGWQGIRFSKQIILMRDAFRERMMQYGVFLASKPE